MFYEIVNGFTQVGQIVLHNIPYHVVIDIKVTVGYMVTHPFDGLPRYLRTNGKQLLSRLLVDTLDTFSYSLYQHTISR